MADIELQLRIENLKFFIQLREQKYTAALHQGTAFAILQPLKDEITKLKTVLNVLLDKQRPKKIFGGGRGGATHGRSGLI